MSHRTMALLASLALAATPLNAGPPWISVELPANPHHPSTRGATMLIRTYHHSDAINAPLVGIAEGIVNGKRVSLPLELRRTNLAGVYAVTTPLPKGGTWIMAITLSQHEGSNATALVTVDPRGRIVNIEVPIDLSRDGWNVPRTIEKKDIEDALRAAHVAYGDDNAATNHVGLAFVLPLMLFGGAAVAGVARRR